jgi:hypothetical protein
LGDNPVTAWLKVPVSTPNVMLLDQFPALVPPLAGP